MRKVAGVLLLVGLLLVGVPAGSPAGFMRVAGGSPQPAGHGGGELL